MATSASATPHGVSIARAAESIGVSQKTIRRAISRGEIQARRLGARMIRIDADSLAAWGRPIAPMRAA